MTTKTKLSIYVVAGIVALASFSTAFMLDDMKIQTTSQSETSTESYLENAVSLYLQINKAGLPVMSSIEIENPRLDNLDFQELRPGTFDFIWRAINNGATFVSDYELQVYHEQVKEPKHRFVIKDGDSVKYYRTSITTPPLDYDTHWIKVLEFAEERNINFKNLDSESRSQIDAQLLKPYRWIPVDEVTANDIKQRIAVDGSFFKANTERGMSDFQIQYLGPLGDEYKNADFVEMLGGDHHE